MASTENTALPFGVRSLAAVMFTDVVNFSGLIGEKEDRTLRLVQKDLEFIANAVSSAGGRVMKTMGDGTLSFFESALSAVTCARHVQGEFAARQANTAGSLLHRIGIHLGDVFVLDNDVLGNSVNIAARLLTCAEPGGICFSQTVFDVVKNRLQLQVHYIGPQELKHIREAVPAYAVPAEACLVTATERVKISTPVRPKSTGSGIFVGKVVEPALALNSGDPFVKHTPPRRPLMLIGDFGGGARAAGVVSPHWVDADNIDQVFRRLGVRVSLPSYFCAGTFELKFESMEDFHPDQLLPRVDSLRELHELRSMLLNARSGPAVLNHWRMLTRGLAPSVEAMPAASTPTSDFIAKLLNAAGEAGATKSTFAEDANLQQRLEKLLKAGRIASAGGESTAAAVAELEREMARELRAMLHHPDFQRLEATWLGARRLIDSYGGGDSKILLVDCGEWHTPEDGGGIARWIDEAKPGLIVADFYVGGEDRDFVWLNTLAKAALGVGATAYAGARPIVAGCESFARESDPSAWNIRPSATWEREWQKLRTSPAGGRLVLVAPRYLARQPYGKSSDPIAGFAFEELPENRAHEAYLWANGAFIAAHLAARQPAGLGSDSLRQGGEISGLPWIHYRENGDTEVVPCAEVWLSEKANRTLAERGLTGLVSVRDRNAVRIEAGVPVASRGG